MPSPRQKLERQQSMSLEHFLEIVAPQILAGLCANDKYNATDNNLAMLEDQAVASAVRLYKKIAQEVMK